MTVLITIKSLSDECAGMQDFLETVTPDEPNEATERLNYLSVYMARSGKMLADARSLQDRARITAFEEFREQLKGMPANTANRIMDSLTHEENYVVNWLDRINRCCVHQSDNIRTIISFAKERMRMGE